jgi:hypothetical protein
MIDAIDKREPDFVNAEGVKWWVDEVSTQYAQRKGLAGVSAWIVEEADGYVTRVLTKDGQALADSTSLEGIGLKIDILALSLPKPRRAKKGQPK